MSALGFPKAVLIAVVIISFPRFAHESYCAFEIGVAGLVGAEEPEECAVVIIQKPQIIKKYFLKNANSEEMQTNEQSNKTLIC